MRFAVCNDTDIARGRKAVLNVFAKMLHNHFSDSVSLKFGKHTDIDNLAKATTITDDSTHANGFVLLVDEYRVEGVWQAPFCGEG